MLGTIVQTQTKGKTEAEFQNYLLGYLVTLLIQNVDRSKLAYLLKTETWNEKCEKTIDLCLDCGYKYGRDDLRCLLNAYYRRVSLLSHQNLEEYRLISDFSCSFIKPSDLILEHENESYELQNYFKNTINVFYVQGNHQSMIANPEIVQILNDINDKI